MSASAPAIEVKAVRKTFKVKGGLLGTDRHVVAVLECHKTIPDVVASCIDGMDY